MCSMVTRTTSIRLDEKLFDAIDLVCKEKNCTRNDFVKTVLDEALNKESVSELTDIEIILD